MIRTGLLLGIVLPACATLNAEHVLIGTPGPPFAGEVKIVMEGSPVSAPYQEVAIVSATGQGAHALLPAILGALQSEAARLGCNAVIRVRYDRGQVSATATGVGVRIASLGAASPR
jgi:hypothetical protein